MRTKQTSISAAIGLLLLGSPVVADDICKLGGMWRLVSFHSEDVVTKARVNIYGERPWGYLTIQCDGRFYAWAANAQRRPVQSVWEDVAQSISELAAPRRAIYYSGIYSLTDDNMVIRVEKEQHGGWDISDAGDILWNESQTQGDDVRKYRIKPNGRDTEILLIETAPMPDPKRSTSTIVGRTVWERVSEWQYAPPN
jgi:hypothetical protein